MKLATSDGVVSQATLDRDDEMLDREDDFSIVLKTGIGHGSQQAQPRDKPPRTW